MSPKKFARGNLQRGLVCTKNRPSFQMVVPPSHRRYRDATGGVTAVTRTERRGRRSRLSWVLLTTSVGCCGQQEGYKKMLEHDHPDNQKNVSNMFVGAAVCIEVHCFARFMPRGPLSLASSHSFSFPSHRLLFPRTRDLRDPNMVHHRCWSSWKVEGLPSAAWYVVATMLGCVASCQAGVASGCPLPSRLLLRSTLLFLPLTHTRHREAIRRWFDPLVLEAAPRYSLL